MVVTCGCNVLLGVLLHMCDYMLLLGCSITVSDRMHHDEDMLQLIHCHDNVPLPVMVTIMITDELTDVVIGRNHQSHHYHYRSLLYDDDDHASCVAHQYDLVSYVRYHHAHVLTMYQ